MDAQIDIDVTEIWENELTITVSSTDPRPMLRHRVVLRAAPDPYRYDRVLTDAERTVTLKDLPVSSRVLLRCCGLFANKIDGDQWSAWVEVHVQLAKPYVVKQRRVHKDKIEVEWAQPEGSQTETTSRNVSLTYSTASRYELRILEKLRTASALVFEKTLEAAALPQAFTLDGLDPYKMYQVKVRPKRAHISALWGRYSTELTCCTLYPVMIEGIEFGQEHVDINIKRNAPQHYFEQLQAFSQTDSDMRESCASISEVFIELLRSDGTLIEEKKLYDIMPHKQNRVKMLGLEPDTPYILKATIVETAGVQQAVTRYLFKTSPPLTILRIRKLTAVLMEVSWVVDCRQKVDVKHIPHDEVLSAQQQTVEKYQVRLINPSRAEIVQSKNADSQNWLRVTGLDAATSYSVQLRYVTSTGYFSEWSRSVTVKTLDIMKPAIDRRGPNFIEIYWSRPIAPKITSADASEETAEGVQYLDEAPNEASKIITTKHPRFRSRAIADPMILVEDPKSVLVGIVEKESEELFSPQIAGARGEGVASWGQTASGDFAYGEVRQFSTPFGTARFDGLQPNTVYRVSINEQNDEGVWYGRVSLYVTTLESGIEALPEHGLLGLDMPYLDDSEVADEGQVVSPERAVGSSNVCNLPATPARYSSSEVILSVEVQQVGENHSLVSWRLVSTKDNSLVSELCNITSENNGNQNPAFSGFTEYKLIVSKMVEERTEGIVSDGVGPSQRCLYLRCQGNRTRLEQLHSDAPYTVRMSVFCQADGQWCRWSEPFKFCTSKHLELNIHAIHRDSCVVRWTREASVHSHDLLRSSSKSAVTAIRKYLLRINDLTETSERQLSLDGKTHPFATHYNISGIEKNTIYRIVVAPQYKNHSWGSSCLPVDLLYLILPFQVDSVGENVVAISWITPDYVVDKSMSKVIMSIWKKKGDGDATEVREDIEIGADLNSFKFQNLVPNAKYSIQVVFLAQILVVTPVILSELMSLSKNTFNFFEREVKTCALLSLSLLQKGESYAKIQWTRACTSEEDNATDSEQQAKKIKTILVKFAETNSDIYSSLTRSRPLITYNVHTTDCETRQTTTTSVSPATSSHPHVVWKIVGLQPSKRYRIAVRRKLSCGAWGSFSNYVFVTTENMLKISVFSVGEDFFRVGWQREESNRKPIIQESDDPEDTPHLNPEKTLKYCLSVSAQPIAPPQTATMKYPTSYAEIKNLSGKRGDALKHSREDESADTRLLETTENEMLLENLTPNTVYSLKVKGLAFEKKWDAWSLRMRTQTLQSISAEIFTRGADQIGIQWTRPCTSQLIHQLRTRSSQPSCYVTHAEAEAMCKGEVIATATTHYFIPDENQQIHPKKVNQKLVRTEVSKTNDERGRIFIKNLPEECIVEVRVRLCYGNTIMGHWSKRIVVDTLPSVGLNLHGMAEDSLSFTIKAPQPAFTTRNLQLEEQHGAVPIGEQDGQTLNRRRSHCSGIVELAGTRKDNFYVDEQGRKLVDPSVGDLESLPKPVIKKWVVQICSPEMHDKMGDDAQRKNVRTVTLNAPEQDASDLLTFSIDLLTPNTLYVVSCKYVDSTESDSPWSKGLYATTLPSVKLRANNVAESFLHASWGREPFDYLQNPLHKQLPVAGNAGCDLKWELVIFDEQRRIQHHEVPGGTTSLKIANLHPNTRLALTIRARTLAPVPQSATPEQLQEMSEGGFAQDLPWGTWSPKVYVTTTQKLTQTVERIGQDYMVVRWLPTLTNKVPADGCHEPSGSVVIGRDNRAKYKMAQPPQSWQSAKILQYQLNVTCAESGEEKVMVVPHVALQQLYHGKVTGLSVGTKYHTRIRACYSTNGDASDENGHDYGSFTGNVSAETASKLIVKTEHVGGSDASFLVLPNRWGSTGAQNHTEQNNETTDDPGDSQETETPETDMRHFDVSFNDNILPEVLSVDLKNPEKGATIGLNSLEVDTQYNLKVRERSEEGEHYAQWVDLHSFYTKPQAPVCGDLTEWRHNTISFTFGILCKASGETLMGKDVPEDYMFCVEVMNKSDTRQAKKGEDRPREQWHQIGTVKEGCIRTVLDMPINECYFRVKAANHMVLDHNVSVPLWGDHSQLLHWKEPLRPSSVAAVRVANLKTHSAKVVWDKPSNATTQPGLGYMILMAHTSEGGSRTWAHVATAPTNHHIIHNLSANSCYRVCIKAVSNFGTSPKSAVLTFTTNIDTGRADDEDLGEDEGAVVAYSAPKRKEEGALVPRGATSASASPSGRKQPQQPRIKATPASPASPQKRIAPKVEKIATKEHAKPRKISAHNTPTKEDHGAQEVATPTRATTTTTTTTVAVNTTPPAEGPPPLTTNDLFMSPEVKCQTPGGSNTQNVSPRVAVGGSGSSAEPLTAEPLTHTVSPSNIRSEASSCVASPISPLLDLSEALTSLKEKKDPPKKEEEADRPRSVSVQANVLEPPGSMQALALEASKKQFFASTPGGTATATDPFMGSNGSIPKNLIYYDTECGLIAPKGTDLIAKTDGMQTLSIISKGSSTKKGQSVLFSTQGTAHQPKKKYKESAVGTKRPFSAGGKVSLDLIARRDLSAQKSVLKARSDQKNTHPPQGYLAPIKDRPVSGPDILNAVQPGKVSAADARKAPVRKLRSPPLPKASPNDFPPTRK